MSWAIWITGLPGSGKSAVAREAAAELRVRGEPVAVLELDAIRKILTPSPTYSTTEREIVYRTLVYLARLLTESGVPVIIDATGHRRAWRDLGRASIPNFAEVQLVCPIEVCPERERRREPGHAPRGIYSAAEQPGAAVPGVNVPYEPALAPDVVIDTSIDDVATAAEKVVSVAPELARFGRAAPQRAPTAPWAIWITGLPGSGKTTLARSVADRLAAAGIPITLLDITDLRHSVVSTGSASPQQEEILHRALVCAAKILTDAGRPVIIDATAPRRRWRELARELIGHYAEVQLLCPSDICGGRERAARWNPTICAQSPRRKTARPGGPDITLDYEPSLHPDLTVYTDVRAVWGVVEEIVHLARRLHRKAVSSPLTLRTPPCSFAT